MDNLSSPHSRQSMEHRQSDGSLPVSNPGVSSRSCACNAHSRSWVLTGNLHHNEQTNSPGEHQEHQEEIEREHEAELRRLLAIIQNQQAQIEQFQRSQPLPETTGRNTALESEGDTTVLGQETQMMRQNAANRETAKPPRPITWEDPFPWDFQPEWPVTRAQRIDELKRIAPFYNSTHQPANIAAAIDWHAQFDPAEVVPADLVIFQGGKKVDEADVQQGEPPWEEGCDDDFVDGGDSTHPAAALGGPSNATGNANYGHFDRSEGGSHMYELKLEVKAAPFYGNNQSFTMDVNYDSGCGTMALPLDDLAPMIASTPASMLGSRNTNTANGRGQAKIASLQVRILTRDKTKVLLPWAPVKCHGYINIRRRIFRGALEDSCFVCSHPRRQRLYVAHTKGQLMSRMPKD